jgi:hypothetical protein
VYVYVLYCVVSLACVSLQEMHLGMICFTSVCVCLFACHVTRLYNIDKIIRRRNLKLRLRKIGIFFLSMSRPELVKCATTTSAQNVFTTNFPGRKNRIGDFKPRNLDFGMLRRGLPLRNSVETWHLYSYSFVEQV